MTTWIRVYYAAERTLLAWIRTGVAMMGFGFVVARFGLFLRELATAHATDPPTHYGMSLWFGLALIVLGAIVNIAASWHHVADVRRLKLGVALPMRPISTSVILAAVLALLGLALGVYLVIVS